MDAAVTLQLSRLLKRLQDLLPEPLPEPFDSGWYRWTHTDFSIGHLRNVSYARTTELNRLCGLDEEIRQLRTNTRCLLKGKTANNVLLTGPRGCGKTTLMREVLNEFIADKLRVVTLNRRYLQDLPALIEALRRKNDCPVIIACDELSFAGTGVDHLEVKAALDDLGQLDHALMYATSNRRHLIPEYHEENLTAHTDATGQVHPEETTEEKISLADRFGLWIPVFAPSEEEYLNMVTSWLGHLSKRKYSAQIEKLAVQWARENGSMNGRTALQFVNHLLQQNSR